MGFVVCLRERKRGGRDLVTDGSELDADEAFEGAFGED